MMLMAFAATGPHVLAGQHAGLFTYFTWSEGATIIAAVAAGLLAAGVAVIGYSAQQRSARRDQRATGYAEALRAVEDYLEAPYRIRRRDGSSAARMSVATHVSDVQSRISLYSSWLSIHAPQDVRQAYIAFVGAAKQDAGPQMTQAWRAKPTRRDWDVPLGAALPQPRASHARDAVLAAMRRDLKVKDHRTGALDAPAGGAVRRRAAAPGAAPAGAYTARNS